MGKRLIQQRRGRGSPTYKSLGFKSKGNVKAIPLTKEEVTGKIVKFINCPLHSAPLASVSLPDSNIIMLAAEGMAINEEMKFGGNQVEVGNFIGLEHIPEGTLIHNVELQPGDGGKICRASGTFARVLTRLEKHVIIILPSKKKKTILSTCRATIGTVAGGGRTEKPILKAGNAYYKSKKSNKLWPRTSGGAMNAVDHPFGNKRSSRKAKAKPVPRNAPPGRKVGMLRPRQTGRSKR